MTEKSNHKTERNVMAFFLWVFFYSWTLWLPYVLVEMKLVENSYLFSVLKMPAIFLGTCAPLFAAITLIARKHGWSQVRKYLRDAFDFHIKAKYYAMALLIPLIITAGAHYISSFIGFGRLSFTLLSESSPVLTVIAFILFFLFMLVAGGGQEEFGWRGYAQEPLQHRFGVLGGSIVLGVVWGVWHLPFWFMGDQHGYLSFFAFLLQIVSQSVIIGWLYNISGKKIVIAWIIHTMGNTAFTFFPVMHMNKVPQPGYWLWAGLNALVALGLSIWFLWKSKYRNLGEAAKENTPDTKADY